MLRPWKLAFPLFLSCTLVLAAPTYPVSDQSLAKRQFDRPKTVTTVHQFQTPAGLATETCEITLTPIKDNKGADAVREEKSCKITVDSSQGNGAATTSSSAPSATTTDSSTVSTESVTSSAGASTTSSASSSPTTSSASSSPTTSSSSSSDTTISTTESPTASPTTASSSIAGGVSEVTPSTTPALSTNPVSTISVDPALSSSAAEVGSTSSPSTGTPTTPTTSPANDSGGSTESPSASPLPASTVAAAAENASSSAVFQIPGKKIEVLPIGLGVFAGISVIALVVVGLVTYERTKYRRAFRQRRLAEQATPMPYGGMSEMPR